MAGKAEEEENYWPGFVDALSTMTMVLTFIMMVLAFAVFIMSKFVSEIKVDIPPTEVIEERAPTAPESDDPIAEIEVPRAVPGAGGIQDAAERVAGSSPYEARVDDAESVISKPLEETEIRVSVIEDAKEDKGQAIAVTSSVITLIYEGVETRLTDERIADIAAAASLPEISEADNVITIRAYADAVNAPISQMRRVAYYRAMLIRSALLDAGIAKERIDVKLMETDQQEEGQKVRILLAPDAR